VIVGTLPAGLIGLLFQTKLEALFGAPILAAAFLCMNGAVLLAAERLTRRQRLLHAQSINKSGVTLGATALQGGAYTSPDDVTRAADDAEFDQSLHEMSFVQAALIGLAQSFALFPGISRSGVTMVAGMQARLSHEEAIRFAFLLATPVIGAAALLEVPKLFGAGTEVLVAALAGGAVAAVAAFLSVRFLTRYFQVGRLTPFAYYCLAAGFLSFAFFSALSLGAFTLPW
jgi:undecaprenyl-diphosphatase